ncbi:MAG: asparagine synthase-related protein [candidate division NC10 bacterium]|nr:asparagine synthase-related protein [candidate division NC10 bacterium]
MNYEQFIGEQIEEIRRTVGDGKAINALSGGVDSSVVTALGYRALGERLKTYFIDNALMREGEPEQVVKTFAKMGIPVELIDARAEFLEALRGLSDPEEKRKAITHTFYARVFRRLVAESGARFLLHGTILTDIEETVAGIKRQHNILAQIGIDPEKEYGYQVLEPLKTLRKDGVREVARLLGLPPTITERIPFPGPALAARIVGEVTEERLAIVRKATAIVEDALQGTRAFQYFATLLQDRATGIREGKREFGQILVIRCIESTDARTASVTELPWAILHGMTQEILKIPGVNRVLYDLTPKPPATVEYI